MRGSCLRAALAILLACAAPAWADDPAPTRADLVVYGATAGGVVTAIAAAREGARVVLLEPGRHVGGMVSGGLGFTDFGRKEVIGGYSLEFFERVGRRYGEPLAWYFEPHVAEEVFRAWLKEAGVTLVEGERLVEREGVSVAGGRVREVRTETGRRYAASVFADASYEGDLMAQAKVSYTVGRESSSQYGESLAGVRDHTPYHQFRVRVSPRDDAGRLLPEVVERGTEAVGDGDRRVQAYNFRLCMTERPDIRVPFPKPAGYAPGRYALLARYLQAWERERGTPVRVGEVLSPDVVRNGKTDTNNNGAFSTDYIGGNYGYPDGSYAERARIWQAHVDYQQGLLYFLANDPSVPAALRTEMGRWGLCGDEFRDTAHWPHQLYVREARRMVGTYVMTQRDIQQDLEKPDGIGMGSYNSDSHNLQRIPTADGAAVENEGDMQVPVSPYRIPFRMILPRRGEATNLLVPVAFSASHVAYSTLRMEPQYMIIGHAAGVAAAMAAKSGAAVQDVDVNALRATLKAQRAVLAR